MHSLTLQASNLSKAFNRRSIFSNVSFTVGRARAFAITGKNGSGKSTLVKILAGVLSASSGTYAVSLGGTEVKREDLYRHVGLVAPYLQMYDEFTALENLELFSKLRGAHVDHGLIDNLLQKVGLYARKQDVVRTYSSGMKQRLKYAFALLHQPPILLLDEPTSNLDAEGIRVVLDVISGQRAGGIVIVATNDIEEVKVCDEALNLDSLSPSLQGGTK